MTTASSAWAAIGGAGYFAAVIVLLHALRPDVDPIARVTSEYAVGPYGFLMTTAYFVLAIAFVALAIGLARSLAASIRATPGVGLLLLAALGIAVAGIFPVDVGAARPVTTDGWIHRVAAIVAFASMTLGPLLLVRPFHRRPGWRELAWPTGAVGAIGMAGLIAIQAVLLERGLAGAAQRFVLLIVTAWMLTVAFRLLRKAGAEERS